MKPLATIPAASLITLAAFWLNPATAEAQWRGVNEKQWAESIQSDIRNGASAQELCTNSTNLATTSKEAAFKNWAQSIAQTYCTAESVITEAAAPTANKNEQCQLDSSDIYRISIGKRVHKQDKGCWSSFN
jgi:hypothetical protein